MGWGPREKKICGYQPGKAAELVTSEPHPHLFLLITLFSAREWLGFQPGWERKPPTQQERQPAAQPLPFPNTNLSGGPSASRVRAKLSTMSSEALTLGPGL